MILLFEGGFCSDGLFETLFCQGELFGGGVAGSLQGGQLASQRAEMLVLLSLAIGEFCSLCLQLGADALQFASASID